MTNREIYEALAIHHDHAMEGEPDSDVTLSAVIPRVRLAAENLELYLKETGK